MEMQDEWVRSIRRLPTISYQDGDDDDDDFRVTKWQKGDVWTQVEDEDGCSAFPPAPQHLLYQPRRWKKDCYAKHDILEDENEAVCPAIAVAPAPAPQQQLQPLRIRFIVGNSKLATNQPSRKPDPPTLDFLDSWTADTLRLGDFDKESEASVEDYATMALNELNSDDDASFDLVECGPIASGVSSTGHFLHLNFKARNNGDPGASVETYFTELVKTNQDVVRVEKIGCLGPSSSLPDKVNTFGCVYCSSHNIHHPDRDILTEFHNGREDHWKALKSLTLKLSDFVSRSEREGFIPPMFSHPGFKFFNKEFQVTSSLFAKMALSLFNSRNKGTTFELVTPGSYATNIAGIVWVVHINFEAKIQDVPDAPVQTFFAEVIYTSHYVFVVFCKCLGPSDSLVHEEANLQGCTCCGSLRIHHPSGPGFLNGRGCLTT